MKYCRFLLWNLSAFIRIMITPVIFSVLFILFCKLFFIAWFWLQNLIQFLIFYRNNCYFNNLKLKVTRIFLWWASHMNFPEFRAKKSYLAHLVDSNLQGIDLQLYERSKFKELQLEHVGRSSVFEDAKGRFLSCNPNKCLLLLNNFPGSYIRLL